MKLKFYEVDIEKDNKIIRTNGVNVYFYPLRCMGTNKKKIKKYDYSL